MKTPLKELLIAEKDQQGSDIASALGLTEEIREIHLPIDINKRKNIHDKWFPKISKLMEKIKTKEDRIYDLSLQYQKNPQKLLGLKKYKVLEQSKNKLEEEIEKIEELIKESYEPISNFTTVQIKIWRDADRILLACSGHLVDITFKKAQTPALILDSKNKIQSIKELLSSSEPEESNKESSEKSREDIRNELASGIFSSISSDLQWKIIDSLIDHNITDLAKLSVQDLDNLNELVDFFGNDCDQFIMDKSIEESEEWKGDLTDKNENEKFNNYFNTKYAIIFTLASEVGKEDTEEIESDEIEDDSEDIIDDQDLDIESEEESEEETVELEKAEEEEANTITSKSKNVKDNFILSVKFETEIIPSVSEDLKYARFTLIEQIINEYDIEKIIVATDYDREGQSIAGSIFEYLNVDFTKLTRMKFSTLEPDVLRDAYKNQIPFDMNFYQSGKSRRWLDYVIGFNVSPPFSKLYTHVITQYLQNDIGINLKEEPYSNMQLNRNSFNMGRVKLVILNYVYQKTNQEILNASKIDNAKLNIENQTIYTVSYTDNSNLRVPLIQSTFGGFDGKNFDFEKPIEIIIDDLSITKEYTSDLSHIELPTFLNLVKVFDLCKDLNATSVQVDKILEYLYLNHFLSYPRSKSEQWEIKNDADKLKYANNLLKTLKLLGYPIKDKYFQTYGREGDEGGKTLSHPCIHPLASITKEKIEWLKKINPLAYLILNEIIIHTIKCFEENPKVEKQNITYTISQNNETLRFTSSRILKILELNILEFKGCYERLLEKIDVKIGDKFLSLPEKSITLQNTASSNRDQPKIPSEYDVIQYLNEKDIGTDSTRSSTVNGLIEKDYFNSPNLLLTTILGNLICQLAERYVTFIDEEYTFTMEQDLNEIEKGQMPIKDFEDTVKDLVIKTVRNVYENSSDVMRLYLKTLPYCEIHKIPMILRIGTKGKYFQCPHKFTVEKCNKTISL